MKHFRMILLTLLCTLFINAETLELKSGWNLVGVNANLSLEEIQSQLGTENLLVIQGEHTTYQKTYVEQNLSTLNDFTAFEEGIGYWIKVVNEVNLSYIPMAYNDTKLLALTEGWNLVHPLSSMTLVDIVSQLGSENIEVIQGETQTYQKCYIDEDLSFLNDFTGFEASKGYWIKVKNSSNLTFAFTPTHFYASDLTADEQKALSRKIIRMQKPSEINIDAITPNIIEIALIPKYDDNGFERLPIDINATHNVLNFSIISEDDSNYKSNTHPVESGLKRRLIYAPIIKNDLRILERIYLNLPYALQEGSSYSVNVDDNVSGENHALEFTYSQNRISTIIHIDPEGYLPSDTKKAYMGMQLGSLGEVVADDLSFVVKRVDTREVVYSGVGTLEASTGWRENFSNLDTLYQNVLEFDFSALSDEGEYMIESPVAGMSQPFPITSNAYRKTLNTLALGVYNQRRGEDIKMPYSRHERLATIENNTYVYDSNDLDLFITSDTDFEGIKYPTTNEGKQVTFESAGHMDAGDYSPYAYNSSEFTWTLLAGLDLFGDKLGHDNLGVPESGDTIPDIYQEMMLELKWLMGMQDDDGGVFGMSKPKGTSYQSKMTGVDPYIQRYLSPKDTPHTASFTAVMARGARSKIIQHYNPELSATLKEKALNAWSWLEANEGFDGWHHYGAKEEDTDDRVWAAIELYALTGEQKYHDHFVANHQPELRDNGVAWFNHGYGYTNRVVAMWDKEGIPYALDATLKEQSLNRYRAMLDKYVDLANSTPYDLAVEGAVKRWNQLGWYFPLYAYANDLVVGHFLYGEAEYLEVAKDQIHFTLGANPNNQSFITGIGNKRLHTLVDQKSRYDGLDQPVNGLPVSPVVSGASWLNSYERNLTNFTYPSTTYDFSDGPAYGLLDESYDGWNVNAEFTIEKLGAMLVTLGYLTEVEEKVYTYPKFNVVTTVIANGKFQASLNFEETPASGKVVWYANGIPVSVNPNFILEQDFSEPTYKLGAEYIDTNGRRWFDEILINTRDYTNTKIPLEPFASSSYSNIWHFDTNTSSDTGIDLTFEGNAKLDDSNLYWMQDASGKALRVENYGDGVKGSIVIEDILEGHERAELDEVTIEALIYSEKFLGRGDETAEMIKFEQSWGAQLQLLRFTWDYEPKTRLARHVLGDDKKLDEVLTENEWHYIKMKIDRYKVYFYVDGEEIYNQDRVEINLKNLFDYRDIAISLGDFVGWIDEFRISVTVGEVNQDSDSDGMPDSWERAYGFNVSSADDALLDSDSDGYTNLQEYQMLSDPTVEDTYVEPIGTNLSSVVDWTTQLPFVDYFKFSRTWITQCKVGTDDGCTWSNSWDTQEEESLDLDDNGWVKSLPTSEDGKLYTRVSTVWDMPDTLPTGRYLVLYEGEGVIDYYLGATKVEDASTEGRDVIDVNIANGLIQLQIVSTDPDNRGEYLRNIRMVKEEDENSTATFNSDFLERIEPFSVIRFMDWQRTNNSDLSLWEDRARSENITYATDKGVPVEIMVDLANTLKRAPWFNIPHQATDNFITQFAKVVRKNLDTNIPIYVEYSNEVWNGLFEQSSWVESQAEVLWSDSTKSGFTKKINWYGMRTDQMCEIFKAEFSDQPKRVTCVLASQSANSWTATQALDCPLVSDEGCAKSVDALAIAPYFGGYLGSTSNQSEVEGWTEEYDNGLSKLFSELSTGGVLSDSTSSGLEKALETISNNRVVANDYNLSLLAYEGGQHLVGTSGVENNEAITNLFITANRDPRMGKLYMTYLQGWKERGGDLLVNFSDISTPSKWGSWGVLEYLSQSLTPKYLALFNYMNGESFDPILSASLSATTVAEDEGNVTLSLNVDTVHTEDISVTLLLSGKAKKGSDYTIESESLTITAGTLSTTQKISILNDDLIEDDENLIIKIETVTENIQQIETSIILKIQDEDGDEDNISDDWENYFGLNPNDSSDASSDSDGDGLTNLEEYVGNSNPNVDDKNSPLLGTNLSSVVDWSSEQPFIDLFKLSREWLTQCTLYGTTPDTNCTAQNSWDTKEEALLDLDEHGWVKSLPAMEDAPIYTSVSTFLALYPEFKTGNYVVLYEGEGTIEYRLGAVKDEARSVDGRDVIEINVSRGGVQIVLSEIDPTNYLRNIQIIPEAFVDAYTADAPFNPSFLEKTAPFKTLRFMDWMNTNETELELWSDRPLLSDARYTTEKGVPLELMLNLSNQLNSSPWFTLPHKADDEFIESFATMVYEELENDATVYVEYSNEVWNGIFPQSTWVENEGVKEWQSSASSDNDKKLNWFGKRTAQMCDIFKEVFANDAYRVKCVMSAQAAYDATATLALDCSLWEEGSCVDHGIDAVAIAPYFGGYIADTANQPTVEAWATESDGGLESIFTEIEHGGLIKDEGALNRSFAWMENYKTLADGYGLKLFTYEGGQHLADIYARFSDEANNLLTETNRDSRMSDIYLKYLNGWASRGGGMFMHFSDISVASKYGCWGALEYVDQNGSAKYDALMEYLGD